MTLIATDLQILHYEIHFQIIKPMVEAKFHFKNQHF